MHVTATYSGKYLPATVEEAEREVTNYLRRVQYRRQKEGLPPLKYMLVTAYTTKRNSEKPVRIHHHIIMSGGLDRDVVEELWRKRKRKGQKKGDRIGFCNADRLQSDENGIAALCTYLVKQSGGKKRWTSSHNLERPYSRTNDGKYNHRQIENGRGSVRAGSFGKRNTPDGPQPTKITGFSMNTTTSRAGQFI